MKKRKIFLYAGILMITLTGCMQEENNMRETESEEMEGLLSIYGEEETEKKEEFRKDSFSLINGMKKEETSKEDSFFKLKEYENTEE